jgi:hypothetical protein
VSRLALFAVVIAVAIPVVPLLLLGLWSRWIALSLRSIARDPSRRPELRRLQEAPPYLRRAAIEDRVAELRALGFVEIGVKEESSLGLRFASRVLWHPASRTFAEVFPVLRQPATSLLTEIEGGGLLYTGASDRPRRAYGRLIEQGFTADTATLVQRHLATLQELGGPALPEATSGSYRELAPTDLMERRLALSRQYFEERFSGR